MAVPSDGFEQVPTPNAIISAGEKGQPKPVTSSVISKPQQPVPVPVPVPQVTTTPSTVPVPPPNRPTRCVWNCFFVIIGFLCLVYYKIRDMYKS